MASVAVGNSYRCPFCVQDFIAPSSVLLFNHIRLVHSLDPNFNIQCSLEGCSRTFHNLRTYQNHLLKHRTTNSGHSADQEQEQDLDSDSNDHHFTSLESFDPETTRPLQASISKETLEAYAAKWILKTSETRSLTRAATLGIIEDICDLISTISFSLKEEMSEILRSHQVDKETIALAEGVFTGCATKPFEGLTTFQKQLQYYRDHFNLIVSSNAICKACHSFTF